MRRRQRADAAHHPTTMLRMRGGLDPGPWTMPRMRGSRIHIHTLRMRGGSIRCRGAICSRSLSRKRRLLCACICACIRVRMRVLVRMGVRAVLVQALHPWPVGRGPWPLARWPLDAVLVRALHRLARSTCGEEL